MAHPAVLQAVQAAFHVEPQQVTDLLEDGADGRVRGAVIVANSQLFDEMGPTDRTRLMWDQLRQIAGSASLNVGVVLLRSASEAQAEGF
jgi:hypothetical protein